MKLIDANKLRKAIESLPNCYNGFSDTYDKACIIGVIDEQPTIEAEPVKAGKWLAIGNTGLATCSCGYITDRYSIYNYCPNCGAKMEGE